LSSPTKTGSILQRVRQQVQAFEPGELLTYADLSTHPATCGVGSAALSRLSRQSDPSLYIRMLCGAQQFVAALRVGAYEEVKQQLEAQPAFTEVSSPLRW
jgi:hypothetical protein